MVVDIVIILFLLFGALIGFKRGFTKSLVSMLGSLVVIVIAFIFKEPLGNFLASVMPFFNFNGLTALNVILYQMIAFIILVIVLSIIVKILLYATTIFEKILNATIVLGIASKFLGALVGLIRNYIIVFIVLYVLSFPFLNFSFLNDSKVTPFVLDHTVILSKAAETTTNITNDLKEVASDENTNKKVIEIMLKYDLVNEDNINKLVEKGKIK